MVGMFGRANLLDNNYLSPRATWKNAFTLEEVNKIKKLKTSNKFTRGVVDLGDSSFEEKDSVRKSSIFFFEKSDETFWMFDKINKCCDRTNKEFFGFDIYESYKAQYTSYDHSTSDFYRYHWDIFATKTGEHPQRKLSVVLQLSDPESYEGGSLMLNEGGVVYGSEKTIGSLIFFPSWVVHAVEPVTKGIRESLVFWFEGPNWR